MTKKKKPAETRTDRQTKFCVNVVNMFKNFIPSGKIEIRDYIEDGKRTGEHSATQYSSEHVIKIASSTFDHKDGVAEVVDTTVHEAHHAAMHDLNCMLLAGGRLTKDEVDLIMERSAWFCGYAARQVLHNADQIKKDFLLTKEDTCSAK